MGTGSHRLDDAERSRLERDGYVVRHGVFGPDEVAAMAAACEGLVEQLVEHRQGNRVKVGSYVFDPDHLNGVVIKWEGDSDVVHGIEPFAHLSPEIDRWAHDPRLIEPMADALGAEQPELFTEKLNLKRPRCGGANPLHQDRPYWVGVAEDPDEVATAIVFLDDATLENGCLHVVPGSHLRGEWTTRRDGDQFLANEIDPEAAGPVDLVPLEVAAGSIVMFGSSLVHCSAPNTSDRPRRALLFSYQPPGRAHSLDALRRLGIATTA